MQILHSQFAFVRSGLLYTPKRSNVLDVFQLRLNRFSQGVAVMRTWIVLLITVCLVPLWLNPSLGSSGRSKTTFSLPELDRYHLPQEAKELLKQNGFVITPGHADEISDVYSQCKRTNQPIFVTTDAVLHNSHIFFDYLLRILEIEKLYDIAEELTDRMLDMSAKQYREASNGEVKEAARLNIGFFAVAKKQFDPHYRIDDDLEELVNRELSNIENHSGLKLRPLLPYVKNPRTPYALEDYSQYIPRGHYTRSEKFETYFKVLMWYGRIDFKLRPGESELAISHGKKMTLQALLMTDAFLRDKELFKLWKKLYDATAYFAGKTDDLYAEDYIRLMRKIFPPSGSVDKYGDENTVTAFIDDALKLRAPKILSGEAYVEDGEFEATTKGFRFMGQRFIPDSYMFQQLVYGVKDFRYLGRGKPFTMEILPVVGPARAFPRGLDVMAVLGSERALQILEQEGDTEYADYHKQLDSLKKEFSDKTSPQWRQNLYWRWLYSLLPLLEPKIGEKVPGFMQTVSWLDKELQTALGSWTELRHDTILYAKQSYTGRLTAAPPSPKTTYGYVEPCPQVYARIEETMRSLRSDLSSLGVVSPGVQERIRQFEDLLTTLKVISEKELNGQSLTDEEYGVIRNIGEKLASLKRFPHDIMEKITSGTDEKMDIIADVHTEPNTKQVLEEAVGSPFNIYVIIDDGKGHRLCHGAVFSYYEFKHPMSDRLKDEDWHRMEQEGKRPPQLDWVMALTAR